MDQNEYTNPSLLIEWLHWLGVLVTSYSRFTSKSKSCRPQVKSLHVQSRFTFRKSKQISLKATAIRKILHYAV